jgi:hypothetical protein
VATATFPTHTFLRGLVSHDKEPGSSAKGVLFLVCLNERGKVSLLDDADIMVLFLFCFHVKHSPRSHSSTVQDPKAVLLHLC